MSRDEHLEQDRALGAQLADWLAGEAPRRARRELLEVVLARTEHTEQRIAWRDRFPLPGGGQRSMALAWLAIAAILALAFSGAVLVAGRLADVHLPWNPGPAPYQRTWPGGWERSTGTTAFANGAVSDVASSLTGPLLVAAGRLSVAGQSEAALWNSDDGVTWKLVPGSVLNDALIGRLTLHGERIVALAYGCAPPPQYICGDQLVLLTGTKPRPSPSASTTASPFWQPAVTAFASGKVFGYSAIVTGGPGYVMVGAQAAPDQYGGTPIGASVATSADGSHWTLQPGTSAAFSKASMAGVATSLVGPIRLVAVGSGASLEPAVWTSADGLSWTRVASSGAPSSGEIDDVAAGLVSGFVAVGRDGDNAVAWISSDGTTWRRAPAQAALDGARMTRVLWLDNAYVALGRTNAGDGVAWMSQDGMSWTRLDTGTIFAGAPLDAAGWSASASRFVLFGHDSNQRVVVAASTP